MLNLFKNAKKNLKRIAITDKERSYSYQELMEISDLLSSGLLLNTSDLKEKRVGLFINPSFDYVATLWGIWKAGGISVPLNLSATDRELTYYTRETNINLIIVDSENKEKLAKFAYKKKIELKTPRELIQKTKQTLPKIKLERRAMILFTSGTTNKPKGVVSTHLNIESQINCLVKAWEWSKDDFIPVFLPLHHIHGIINSLLCPLWVGGRVDIIGAFQTEKVAKAIMKNNYSVFTAVPTIYFSLIENLEAMEKNDLKILKDKLRKMRLMMSGSAALASEIHKKWTRLTGQILLERYGMTEIGMAIANPLIGRRKPGFVGLPLPKVKIKLIDENQSFIKDEKVPGEIICKGPQVFFEYWNKPQLTKDSFKGGWFKTGDIAQLEGGYYRILGRKSIDVINSGGIKISALEIEDLLLKHPYIKECSIIGIPDKRWGEMVVAILVTEKNKPLTLRELKDWSKKRISSYKIPKKIKILKNLPKNSLGKVIKNDLKINFKS